MSRATRLRELVGGRDHRGRRPAGQERRPHGLRQRAAGAGQRARLDRDRVIGVSRPVPDRHDGHGGVVVVPAQFDGRRGLDDQRRFDGSALHRRRESDDRGRLELDAGADRGPECGLREGHDVGRWGGGREGGPNERHDPQSERSAEAKRDGRAHDPRSPQGGGRVDGGQHRDGEDRDDELPQYRFPDWVSGERRGDIRAAAASRWGVTRDRG